MVGHPFVWIKHLVESIEHERNDRTDQFFLIGKIIGDRSRRVSGGFSHLAQRSTGITFLGDNLYPGAQKFFSLSFSVANWSASA